MSSAQEDSKFKKPSSSYWVGRPATIGEGFVGCEPKLQAIDDAFKSLKKVVVISGGAGTGKSRLAAEFSHRSGVPGFWTTAGGNCVQTLTALAQSIDVSAGEATDEEIAVAVQRRLSDLSPETLWIVDNLDDLNQVNELATAAGPVRDALHVPVIAPGAQRGTPSARGAARAAAAP